MSVFVVLFVGILVIVGLVQSYDEWRDIREFKRSLPRARKLREEVRKQEEEQRQALLKAVVRDMDNRPFREPEERRAGRAKRKDEP
jgi:predicted Holliday junction resolvase-like endonuclease